MLRNYIKIAFRNLKRHKLYSFINIGGLAVGLAVFMLLALFVHYEFSFDRYNKNADRIYRVVYHYARNGKSGDGLFTPAPLEPALVRESPAVQEAFRLRDYGQALVERKDHLSFENGLFVADPSIFRVMTLPMAQGNPQKALLDPDGIVINESIAHKYFGYENPLGKILVVNKKQKTVTGVIRDMPANAHFHILLLEPLIPKTAFLSLNDWSSYGCYTYVLLKNGHKPSEISHAIQQLILENSKKSDLKYVHFGLQALTDIHLYSQNYTDYGISESDGDIRYVILYSAIALLILIIACINYVNLTTARSIRRIREVALRKVVGAGRHQLINQFLGESLLLSLLAVIFGFVLAELFLPVFGTLIHRQLSLSGVSALLLIGFLLFLILCIGLGVGGYLAFYLSRFRPTRLFQTGIGGGTRNLDLRRGLIVFQVIASATLILSTLIIYRQLVYVRNTPLGFNKENVVSITPVGALNKSGVLKQKMSELSGISGITSGFAIGARMYAPVNPNGIKGSGNKILTAVTYIDTNFFHVMGIHLVRGRNFSSKLPTDSIKSVIINQTAAQAYGWKKPLGNELTLQGKSYHVIGIVKNYHFKSLKSKIRPLIFLFKPTGFVSDDILARVKDDHIHQTLQQMEAIWKSVAPGWPFLYHFVDQQLNQLYTEEQHLADLIGYFTVIAVILACLGLLGLAAFSAEQRTKEIGIRKVLGASVAGIVALLSKDFLKLVGIGFLIAVPIAWYAMHQWLQNFAYHIHISVLTFVFAGTLAMAIALITVSWQSIRAAIANPVESLRNE